MNIPAIWNIFLREPVCIRIVRNITSTHMAQGLNPSTKPRSIARIGSEYSRRFTTPMNGRLISSRFGGTTQGASAEHHSHHLWTPRVSILFSNKELFVKVLAVSWINFPVVSAPPNPSIISLHTRIIGVTFER